MSIDTVFHRVLPSSHQDGEDESQILRTESLTVCKKRTPPFLHIFRKSTPPENSYSCDVYVGLEVLSSENVTQRPFKTESYKLGTN